MKRLLLVVSCLLLLAGTAGATTFSYLLINDNVGFGTQWNTAPDPANRYLLGVSTDPGGPLINVVSNPLEVGHVYYLYAGNLDVGNWDTGSAHEFMILTSGWATPGIQVLSFHAQGTPGTFSQIPSDWWTYDLQHATFDTNPSSLPDPLPLIWLGWAQGTADLVGRSYLPGGDGSSDVYLVLGIGVQPTNVPLPGAAWLLGSGLVGLAGLRPWRQG